MIEYLSVGIGFAFAAAVQPGPLQAFLFSRVAAQGWRRTLPAALSPLLSDVPIALVVLLVLNRLPPSAARVLQAAGGVLLLYLAVMAWRSARRNTERDASEAGSAPRTLLAAVAVNLLNPNPYLGWSLVLGPLALKAWAEAPSHAVVLIGAFYITMVATLAATIVLFGATRYLAPRSRRALVLASAIVLGALGVWQLAVGVWPR
jgi:threonine/homoserine/homoserine lactone efflux protein